MEASLTSLDKIAHNLGLVVLQSQSLEISLKFLVTMAARENKVPVAKTQSDLKKRSLGLIIKELSKHRNTFEGDIDVLEDYLKYLADTRNKYVHHYFETFSEQLKNENYSEIIREIGEFSIELKTTSKALRDSNDKIAIAILNETDA